MSSGAIDPIQNPQAWQVIQLGSSTSPGVCIVSGFRRAHEWDVKKGKGALGATITFVQRPPAKGSVEFLLWQPIHFQQWDIFRPLLKYDPTKKAVQAIDIYHPSLADVEISSVVTENIGAIEHKGDGLYSITVDFMEYFPPPKASAVSTPAGSKSGTKQPDPTNPTGVTDDPVADAQQKEIAALLQKASQP